jgi:hypothetical protein
MLRISIPFPVGYTYQNNYTKGKQSKQQYVRHGAVYHIFEALVTASYLTLTSVQIAEIFGLNDILSSYSSISPTLNYTAHAESSVYSQISQLIRFFTSKTVIY